MFSSSITSLNFFSVFVKNFLVFFFFFFCDKKAAQAEDGNINSGGEIH
jgi:hypothetical protein